jgi:hypothetical protein
MNNSPSALALKEKLMPDQLRRMETALKGVGINPTTDIEQLTFASFRNGSGLRVVGVAQGQFPMAKIMARIKKQKIKPTPYRAAQLYPMASGMYMVLLDSSTMLFGEPPAVKNAIDARDGQTRSLNANTDITDMMSSVESEPIWSVLDQAGTQAMMKNALGEAAKLADYDMVKKRLLGSRYFMSFDNGVDFNLKVATSDAFTAMTLSSVMKAGMLYKKATATDNEKKALDSLAVNSDSRDLNLEFKTDNQRFQSLLNSDLFNAVSR